MDGSAWWGWASGSAGGEGQTEAELQVVQVIKATKRPEDESENVFFKGILKKIFQMQSSSAEEKNNASFILFVLVQKQSVTISVPQTHVSVGWLLMIIKYKLNITAQNVELSTDNEPSIERLANKRIKNRQEQLGDQWICKCNEINPSSFFCLSEVSSRKQHPGGKTTHRPPQQHSPSPLVGLLHPPRARHIKEIEDEGSNFQFIRFL